LPEEVFSVPRPKWDVVEDPVYAGVKVLVETGVLLTRALTDFAIAAACEASTPLCNRFTTLSFERSLLKARRAPVNAAF
jgi:hypothetical protein